jgi:hypothetical protein
MVPQGLAEDVRKDVWPFLLRVYPWQSGTEERKKVKVEKTCVSFLARPQATRLISV